MGSTSSKYTEVLVPEPPATYGTQPVETSCRRVIWKVDHDCSGKVNASIDGFRTEIEQETEDIRGGDMPVAEIIIPRHKFNLRHGRSLSFNSSGLCGGFVGATIVFQSSIGNGSVFLPMETIYVSVTRDLNSCCGSVKPKSYANLESALNQAGNKGYTFTCVIDTPTDTGVFPKLLPNIPSQTNPLYLVCQRPANLPLEHVVHKLTRIRVRTKSYCALGYRSICDKLTETVGSFLRKGWRLAGAHTPPYFQHGLCSSYLTELVLIFVYVGVPYIFTLVPVPVRVADECGATCLGRSELDHHALMEAAGIHGRVGWQLGAVLDLPMFSRNGCEKEVEMVLVLQAQVTGSDTPAFPRMQKRPRAATSYSSVSTKGTGSSNSHSKTAGQVAISYAHERMKKEMLNAPERYGGREDWRGFPVW